MTIKHSTAKTKKSTKRTTPKPTPKPNGAPHPVNPDDLPVNVTMSAVAALSGVGSKPAKIERYARGMIEERVGSEPLDPSIPDPFPVSEWKEPAAAETPEEMVRQMSASIDARKAAGLPPPDKEEIRGAALDAAFPGWRAARAEDATVLRRDVQPLLPNEYGDATLQDLVYSMAGADGAAKGVADAACVLVASEMEVIRCALFHAPSDGEAEFRDALQAMLYGISQRLLSAGEIERRRIDARKGVVAP